MASWLALALGMKTPELTKVKLVNPYGLVGVWEAQVE